MNMIIETGWKLWDSLPSWGQALPLLLAGVLLALAVRYIVSGALMLLRFDKLGERTGLSDFLRKGKVSYVPSKLAGLLAFWVVLGGVFMKVARRLDMDLAQALSTRLHEIIPGLIAATLLCVLGMALVIFAGNLAGTIIRNAGFSHAEIVATLLKYLGSLLVLAVAFEQVGFGKSLLSPLIQIFFAALAFGVALAFGLGCKEMAKDFATKLVATLRERNRSEKTDLEG